MTQWTVYVHAECSLCEALLDELAHALGTNGIAASAHAVSVIDVAQDPALERKYGQRVPVLLADGDFVCQYRLDPERLEQYLGA